MGANLAVTRKSETELVVHHAPDFSTIKFVTVVVVVSSALFFAGQIVSPKSNWITFAFIVAFVSFFILAICIFDAVELECFIDKATGNIIHKRGGILRSWMGAKETTTQMSAIVSLEIKRYIMRGPDIFQISFGLKNDEKLYLTARNLRFSEAHQYAEQIHHFLGKEIPLKAVD